MVDPVRLREALGWHVNPIWFFGRSEQEVALLKDIEAAARAYLDLIENGIQRDGYLVGWCAKHDDLARRWPDGSWGCWWECTVESSGHHDESDFVRLVPDPEEA